MDREAEITIFFPKLKEDKDFLLTSPMDAEYNCLAWASERNDVWMWPVSPDDDEYFWPQGIDHNLEERTLVEVFEMQGFSICHDDTKEEGTTKIALYSKNGEATHAARQLPNGLWTSKLGWLEDIQHGMPESIEGDFYGKVFCYMKRKL